MISRLSVETGLDLHKRSNMDEKIIQAIEAILRRGNDAEVRKKGDGVIVLEVKKTIKHSA